MASQIVKEDFDFERKPHEKIDELKSKFLNGTETKMHNNFNREKIVHEV